MDDAGQRAAFFWTVRRAREMAHGTDSERRRYADYLAALRGHPQFVAMADAIEEYCQSPPPEMQH